MCLYKYSHTSTHAAWFVFAEYSSPTRDRESVVELTITQCTEEIFRHAIPLPIRMGKGDIHANLHTYIHTYIHTDTYINAYIRILTQMPRSTITSRPKHNHEEQVTAMESTRMVCVCVRLSVCTYVAKYVCMYLCTCVRV